MEVFFNFFYRYSSRALTMLPLSCISTTGVFEKPPSLMHTCQAMRSYVRSIHHDVLACIGQTGSTCHIKCKNFLKSRFPLQGMSTSNNNHSYKHISGLRFEPGILRTLSCHRDVMITNQMILRERTTNKKKHRAHTVKPSVVCDKNSNDERCHQPR
jgi:hypothetical protein